MNTCFKRLAKRSIIILALTMTIVTTVLCQNLTGTIRYKSNSDPVIGAFVVVRNSSDTTDVKGNVTDFEFLFEIDSAHLLVLKKGIQTHPNKTK